MKKFKRAVTDSYGYVKYEEGRAAMNNLISIYCSTTGKTAEEVAKLAPDIVRIYPTIVIKNTDLRKYVL